MSTTPPEGAGIRNRQRQQWNLAAPGWGQWQNRTERGDPVLTERLLDLAGIRPGQRVLDLACGVGDPAFAIADRVGPDGAVLGLDLSPAMVAGAEAGAIARGLGHVAFRLIESELDLGVPDGSFDAATCRFGLMFMPDPARAAATLRRALKPGARLAVCTWGPPERVPYFSTLMGIVRRHVDLPAPAPGAPGPTILPTPAAVEDVFRGGGFAEIETGVMEATSLAAESAGAFWDAAVMLAGPLVAAMSTLQADEKAAIRAGAVRTLGGLYPEGPIRMGGEVVLAAGTNPG